MRSKRSIRTASPRASSGMGDVLSLIEEAERKVDKRKAKRLAGKVKRGRGFDLADFRDQLRQMSDLGGAEGMMDRLPGMGQLAPAKRAQIDDGMFRKMAVVIDSMTLNERQFPNLINGSRKRRIAAGSGTSIQDVNQVLKQHRQMQKTMKKVTRKGAMKRMMRGLEAAQGGAPVGGRRR